jgi:hypothetical protein
VNQTPGVEKFQPIDHRGNELSHFIERERANLQHRFQILVSILGHDVHPPRSQDLTMAEIENSQEIWMGERGHLFPAGKLFRDRQAFCTNEFYGRRLRE